MKIDDRSRFTLRLPEILFIALGEQANTLGLPLNGLIQQIISEWIGRHNRDEPATATTTAPADDTAANGQEGA